MAKMCVFIKVISFFPINSFLMGDTCAWWFSVMSVCEATKTPGMGSDLRLLGSTGGNLAAPGNKDNWAWRGTGGGERWPLAG